MQKRTILSGNKKPIGLITSSKGTKVNKLNDHTSKIEQRLLKLKQQVQQKRRSTFTKNKPPVQSVHKVDKQLNDFLSKIGMIEYEKVLYQNGIDTFEIIKHAKQKDLQQLGIVKGHALKIIISLRKMLQSREKQMRKQLSSAQTAENTQKITSKFDRNGKNRIKQVQNKEMSTQNKQESDRKKVQPLQIVIQTDSVQCGQQQLPKRRYFCMYCYQVSLTQFCSESCEAHYNKMFQRYQNNLAKVQQLYGSKLQRIQHSSAIEQYDENEFISDLDFLDTKQNQFTQQQFDNQIYGETLQFIKNINLQSRQQRIQELLEQKQSKNANNHQQL